MRKIDRSSADIPEPLKEKGKAERLKNEALYDKGIRDFDFNSDIYKNSKKVKPSIKALQYNKCAYCESKVSSTAYGDIEHFRPKGAWIDEDGKLKKPGYYWLAYEWENLLYSCQICNQFYKKNHFPLKDPSKRTLSHHMNLEDEDPLLINPLLEDPEKDIYFNQHIISSDTERGKATIRICGLDRKDLDIERERLYKDTENLIQVVELFRSGLSALHSLAEDAEQRLKEKILAEAPFSSMTKCAIRKSSLTDILNQGNVSGKGPEHP